MKKFILTIALAIFTVVTFAQKTTTVKGYTKKDGTVVSSDTKTTPNYTKKDNYSTYTNYNPSTGKKGTVKPVYMTNPSYSPSSTSNNSTYKGKTVITGAKGGKYYTNSNGNKTYIK